MRNCSTTSDFFNEQSEKSAIKSAIVTDFFKLYIKIINAKFAKKMYYIDLFSGPGRYENGSPSTPIHILDAIQSYYGITTLKIQCVFNERKKEFYNKLKENISSHEAYDQLLFKPIIMNEDAADINLHQYVNGRNPVFSFIDPFGYKGVSATQIWQLVKNIGSDCIFFFNANRIIMDFSKPNKEREFTDIFGKRYQELSEDLQKSETHFLKMKSVLKAFSENLQDIVQSQTFDYQLYILPFAFCFDDREKDSHYLLFITKNHKAISLMKDVMAKFATTISEIYTFDSKTVNQLSLFNIEDDGYINFNKTIVYFKKHFLGKEWVLQDFYKLLDDLSMKSFHKVTPFTSSEMKKFLRRYYDEGKLISMEKFKSRETFKDTRIFKLKED